MILINAEDVVHSLAAAQHVYNTGFRRATVGSEFRNEFKQEAKQLIYGGPKYKSFGEDIRILSLNLDILSSIIQRAQLQAGTPHSPGPHFSGSLGGEPRPEPVLGSISGTLSDCDRLLNDQRYFHKHEGYVAEIYWYYQVDPEVERLRSRVNTHNSKLAICLMILDPYVLENSFHQIADPFSIVRADIEQLGRQVRGYEDGKDSFNQRIVMAIPPQLEDDFTVITREVYPDLSTIPLVRGIDAAIFCFASLSKTPDQPVHNEIRLLTAIVSVMKALWVLRTLQATFEYHINATYQPANPFERHMALCGLNIGRFFEKFEEEIYHVLRPLVGKDLLLPPTPDLLEILEQDKQIWPQDVRDGHEKKTAPLSEHSELGVKILTGHLRSSEPGYTQSMQVYSQTEKRFNLAIVKANVLQGRERETVDGYDLEKVQLIPSYAMRTWSSPPLDPQAILFKVDSVSPVNRILPFQQPKDMLEFQQSITGYKVIHDESRILATSQESKVFGGSRRQDLCRLQLWTAKATTPIADKSPNSPYLMTPPGAHSRKLSQTTFTSSSNSAFQPRRKPTPSIFSTSSRSSSRSSIVIESSSLGKGTEDAIYSNPTPPCVVLFSHKVPELGTDVTMRSFLIIDINPEVVIEEDLAEIEDSRNPSYRCVIERRKGFLPAKRSPETSDPNLWDLAVAGLHKRQAGTEEVKKLKHVILQFDSQNNLLQFMTKFKQAKDLAKLRLAKFMQATG